MSMSKGHLCDTKLVKPLRFGLSRIKEIEGFFYYWNQWHRKVEQGTQQLYQHLTKTNSIENKYLRH